MKAVLIVIIFFLIGFFTVLLYGKWDQTQTVQKAKKSTEVTNEKIPFAVETAPKQSLKAEIIEMTGDIYWESRIATSPALLQEPRTLQQGESLETRDDAAITIAFPEEAEISIGENARFSLIQTLPERLVFGQSAGGIVYQNMSESALSVRSLSLLIVQEKGKMTVTVSDEDRTVSVLADEGTVTMAFNDFENSVSKIALGEGQEYLFDEVSRTGEILE